MTRAKALPELVRRRAEDLGEPGRAWLAGLDALVAALERDWRIETGMPLKGGTAALVAPARTHTGEAAILKIAVPGEDLGARVLIAANGRGYARVLAHDDARGAMLLERLGRSLAAIDPPVSRQVEVICATLGLAWMAPWPDAPFMNGAQKARWLADFIKAEIAQAPGACAERTIATALGYCAAREAAFDPANVVLAHADCHALNTLETLDGRAFKFVDPEGLIIERAYDLSIPMREWEDDLAPDPVRRGRARLRRIAELSGEAEEPIWQWGFIERVSSGLMLKKLGEAKLAAGFLAIADAWALDT